MLSSPISTLNLLVSYLNLYVQLLFEAGTVPTHTCCAMPEARATDEVLLLSDLGFGVTVTFTVITGQLIAL